MGHEDSASIGYMLLLFAHSSKRHKEWEYPHFFVFYPSVLPEHMSHPLIPQILRVAEETAAPLGLEIVDVVLHTHKNPAVLRIDIRNPERNTGLEDCERMSLALETELDRTDIIPHAYVLEVSSPGTDRHLQSDREFVAFRGFTVTATTTAPYEGKQSWTGQLIGRDAENLTLSQKGRLVNIPRHLIQRVELS
jgi:ribosome maturation factor RimP